MAFQTFAKVISGLRQPGFQRRLALKILLIATLAILAASSTLFLLVRSNVKRDREKILKAAARLLAVEYERQQLEWVQEIEQSARFVTKVRSHFADNAEMQDFYLRLTMPESDFDLILITDGSGRVVNAIPRSSAAEMTNFNGKNIEEIVPGGQNWIKEVFAQGSEIDGLSCQKLLDNAVGDFYIVLAAPVQAAAPADPYQATQPLKKEALVAFVNCKQLQQPLHEVDRFLTLAGFKNGDPYLVQDDASTVIGDSDPKKIGSHVDVDYASVRNFDSKALIGALRNAPTVTAADTDAEPATYSYDFKGPKTTAIATLVPPNQRLEVYRVNLGSHFRWHVAVGIYQREMYKLIASFGPAFVWIPTAIAAAVLIAAIYSSMALRVTLAEFTELIRAAARGDISELVSAGQNDEVGALGDAVNELLISVRSSQPFMPLDNPYIVGNPIRSQEMFFGRKDELTWIRTQLNAKTNRFISLVGQRRIGKTSLLHQVNANSGGDGALSFFLDTQKILPGIYSDADLYRVLCNEIAEQARCKSEFKTAVIATDHPTDRTVRKLLRSLLSNSDRHRRVVLLVDELDNFDDKFNRKQLNATDVILFFAGLLEGEMPISFVTSASERTSLDPERWSVLLPKIISRRIGLLSISDAKRLVEDPLRGKLLYAPGTVPTILRLSGGHPYYTQFLCQNLVDRLNAKRTPIASPREVSETLDFVLSNAPTPLSHQWATSDPHIRAVMGCLADILEDEHDTRTFEQIVAAVGHFMPSFSERTKLQPALLYLRDEDWVEETDHSRYRFRVDLLRLWLKRHHPPYSIAAEVAMAGA